MKGWKLVIIWECEVRDKSYLNWLINRITENV